MLFENPAVAAKLSFPYNVPPPMQATAAVPNISAAIKADSLIHHDLHNALVAIKSEQVQQNQIAHNQQQSQSQQQPLQSQALQLQQNGTTISHSGSSGRSTPNGTDTAPGKLFVGGLSWQTSEDKLKEYFGMFGKVLDVLIMKDPVTQRSRGFGFITFMEPGSVDNVLKVPNHTLDGKKIDPKHATPKNRPKLVNRTKKIFVGGVSQDTSADEVKSYFNQFGKVEETVMLMDTQTKRHRGFGFVTLENEDIVDRVCEIHFHTIKNKKVECKKAQPKEAVAPPTQLLQKRIMLGGLGVRMIPQAALAPPGSVAAAQSAQLHAVQQAQAAQAAQAAAVALQAQNVAASGFGKILTYPPLHGFRYSPYSIPSAAHAHAAAAAAAHNQQHQQQTNAVAQQQPQQQATHLTAAQHLQPQSVATAAAVSNMAGLAAGNPYQAAYGLPNVDMTGFQNVDWSSMYGMGMYV